MGEGLGESLAEWNRTLEGPIATSALELRVGEQRLIYSIYV